MSDSPGSKNNVLGWRRNRLLLDDLPVAGTRIALEGPQAHYLTNVLRQREGAVVFACDGKGTEVRCRLVREGRRGLSLEWEGPSEFAPADPRIRVHIGQGRASRNRLDWAVEKMTEAGIASIAPLTDFGTDQHDRHEGGGERWKRVAGAAAMQCGRMTVPEILPEMGLAKWAGWLPDGCLRIQLDPGAAIALSKMLATGHAANDIAFIIGRTSGLGQVEVDAATGLGFKPVRLGQRVLRTETVGVAVTAITMALFDE